MTALTARVSLALAASSAFRDQALHLRSLRTTSSRTLVSTKIKQSNHHESAPGCLRSATSPWLGPVAVRSGSWAAWRHGLPGAGSLGVRRTLQSRRPTREPTPGSLELFLEWLPGPSRSRSWTLNNTLSLPGITLPRIGLQRTHTGPRLLGSSALPCARQEDSASHHQGRKPGR